MLTAMAASSMAMILEMARMPVAPKNILLTQIFGGCMPFVYIVLVCMTLIYIFPSIATWLPDLLYTSR